MVSIIGSLAAILTSLSYVPQVKKTWPRDTTSDLSSKTLAILTLGLVLWIVYGAFVKDWLIISANAVGASLSGSVLCFKIRDTCSNSRRNVCSDAMHKRSASVGR